MAKEVKEPVVRLRSKAKRLSKRTEIEWLDHPERIRRRSEIKKLTTIVESIEEGKPLDETDIDMLSGLTGSDEPETWTDALYDLIETATGDYESKLKLMAQHDLTAYHEYINPSEPPAHHHIWMSDELMLLEAGLTRTLLLSMPPGVAKSSYGSRSFSQWCMGRNPDWSVLMGGYNQKFSDNEFSKPNRDTINSERYRDVFPDIFLGENDQAADHWKLDGWRGKYYSRGANAGVAGIRAMLTNLDDPIGKAETAKSPTERDKLWRWLTTDIMPRRLPGNRLLMIETRWHSGDPIGRLETLYNTKPEAIIGPVKIINVPAQALEGVEDPLGRKPGEWIWERNLDGTPHYTEQHYQTLQLTMPPGDWAALYMGQPLDGKGDYVEEDNFQRYQTLPKVEDRGVVTISVDTAQKATERSNYTAITVWIKDVNRKHYLAYAQRVKNKMDDVVPLLTRLALNWTANSILIEDAGFGSQILQNYQGKLPCPLVEYSPHSRSSKEFQFENAVEYIISGQCLFPEQAPWLTDYINELVAFPDGTNDDYVDSTAQYITHAVKFRRGGTKKLKVGSKRR